MSMTEIIKVFGERKIRSVWDDAPTPLPEK